MSVIRVGQKWKTRSGQVVSITADRGEDAPNGWRWACSNSHIAHHPDGRVGFHGNSDHDLMELLEDQGVTQQQALWMDSSPGQLGGKSA